MRTTPLLLLNAQTSLQRRRRDPATFAADFDAAAGINALDPATATAAELAAETRTMLRYAEFPEFIDSKDKAMGDEIAATFIEPHACARRHRPQKRRGSGG